MNNTTQSDSQVICPNCNHQFRAIPENVQVALASQAEQVRKLEAELAAARVNGKYGWDTAREAHKVYEAEHTLLLAANETIAALQARVEAADKPILWVDLHNIEAAKKNMTGAVLCGLEQYDGDYSPLFTRPPITSERELELLAVIEQKDVAIKAAIARTIRRLYETCPECDTKQNCEETKTCCMCKNVEPELTIALALTPESALKEDRAKLLTTAMMNWNYNVGIEDNLSRMAEERRKP